YDVMVGAMHMLKRDGKLWQPRLWREGWQFLFARDGILRRLWPAYKDYYREGFHPWQRDTHQLLYDWRAGQGEAAPTA
nr:metal-dependent hydrolase [Halieaceae bacterium]